MLSSSEEMKSIMNLEAPDAQIFIDLLDKVCDAVKSSSHRLIPPLVLKTVNCTDDTSVLHAQCLRCLRKLCGRAGLLPSSCVLSEGLSLESTDVLMSGGFADIWRGKLGRKTVALKVLRIRGSSNLQKVKKVCMSFAIWHVHPLNGIYRVFAKRQFSGSHCHIQIS